MRIPKKPPRYSEILQERSGQLLEAVGDPNYQAFAAECQRKYRHWDKARHVARGGKLDPELAWGVIDMLRFGQRQFLPLRGAGDQPLRYSQPPVVQRLLSLVDQKLARDLGATGKLLTDAQRERVIHGALQEEATTSSMLEGAATTRREAKAMLREGRPPRSRGEQMVFNNYAAIEFVREHTNTDLTPEFLLELQAMLTRDTLDRPDEVGRFRRSDEVVQVVDVRTNEVLHDPPPADDLTRRLTAFCRFANDDDDAHEEDDDFLHPVLRAITLHFQIGFDHPFCDGNGRTARTLFYWSMLRQGYALFEYLPISRFIYGAPSQYQKAYLYTETDAFDLTYFYVYHLRIIQDAIRSLADHVTSERERLRKLRRTARPVDINDRQWEALQDLRNEAVDDWSVQDYQDVFDVSYGTARNDLQDLQARDLVRRVKLGRQYKYLART
ncbi:MAG: Fic family protein [Planctomycetota bacterium]